MRRLGHVVEAAVVLAMLTAGAEVSAQNDAVQIQNGHEFVCTGVGKNSRADPRWPGFPLKLVFANRQGDYLTDISISIMDTAGTTLVDAHCNAPWLLAKLKAGKYKGQAQSKAGQVRTFEIEAPASGQKQIVVTFD